MLGIPGFSKDKMKKVFKAKIEELLREAEREHAKYEAELGHEDSDWAMWYAEYMSEQLFSKMPNQ